MYLSYKCFLFIKTFWKKGLHNNLNHFPNHSDDWSNDAEKSALPSQE